MPERLTPYRRSRIVRMRLEGYGRNEIGRQTGENPVTVGRELRRFEHLAASRGLWQASDEYNVTEQVQRLFRVAEVAREHKLTPEELAEAKAKELEARCVELTQRETNLKATISELKEEKRRLGHAIDVYAKLKARGLKDATLLLVQRLVDEAGLAVPNVIAEIKDLAQLEERKREAIQQLNALRREVEGKQLLLQDLTNRRMELERGISQFLEGLLGKLNELGERLASTIAASSENAQREADAAVKAINARVEQLNVTIGNAAENVGKAVGAVGAEIERLLEKARAASSSAIIASKQIGKMELVADVWRLLEGKQLEKEKVLLLLMILVPKLLTWAEKENLYALSEKMVDLKEELEDLVRYGTG